MDSLIVLLLLVVFAGLRSSRSGASRADLLVVTLVLAVVIFITQAA